jgi:hypothetical protein
MLQLRRTLDNVGMIERMAGVESPFYREPAILSAFLSRRSGGDITSTKGRLATGSILNIQSPGSSSPSLSVCENRADAFEKGSGV